MLLKPLAVGFIEGLHAEIERVIYMILRLMEVLKTPRNR